MPKKSKNNRPQKHLLKQVVKDFLEVDSLLIKKIIFLFKTHFFLLEHLKIKILQGLFFNNFKKKKLGRVIINK